MKKNNLLILSAAIVLGLGACAIPGNTPAGSSSNPTDSSENSESSVSASGESSESGDVTSESSSASGYTASDLSADLRKAVRGAASVNAGTWEYKYAYPGNEPAGSDGTYTFGDNAVCYSESQWGDGYQETWYFTEDGEEVAYSEYKGEFSKPWESANEDTYRGYNFTYKCGFNPMSTTLIGVEEVLNNVWSYGSEDAQGDLAISNENGTVKATFTVSVVNDWGNTEYFALDMSVAFDATSGAITSTVLKTQEISGSAVTVDEDGKFSYADEEDSYGISYTLTVTQTVGERTATPEHSIADFDFTAWELYDGETKITDGATVEADLVQYGSIDLNVAGMAPAFGSTSFDPFEIDIDGDTGEFPVNIRYNSYSGQLCISNIENAGTFPVTISTKNVSLSFTLKTSAPEAEEFAFYSVKLVGDEEYSYWDMMELYGEENFIKGKPINIMTEIRPALATCEYDFVVKHGEDTIATTTNTGRDWSGDFTYETFTPSEVGEYTITATDKANAECTNSVTITVSEPKTLDQIFNGKLSYVQPWSGETFVSATFTPNTETAADGDGTVVISDTLDNEDYSARVSTWTYVANEAKDGLVLTYVSGDKPAPAISFKVGDSEEAIYVRTENWGDDEMPLYPETQNEDVGEEIGIF